MIILFIAVLVLAWFGFWFSPVPRDDDELQLACWLAGVLCLVVAAFLTYFL